MAEQALFIHTSPEPLSNDQPQDIDPGQQAVTQGGKHTHHYYAIPTAFKGIERYLALSSFPIITTAHLPPQANNPSHHPTEIDTTGARSGPSSTLPSSASPDEAEHPHSSIASASNGQLHPRRTVPRPKFKKDGIPPGKAEDIIAWTDDDVDATDYKNTPDYDPNQEESEYDSTPPPETEIVASQTLDDNPPDTSVVRRYGRIYSSAPTSSVEEVSDWFVCYPLTFIASCLTAKYLLLLFIPGPLNPLTPPSSPGDTHKTPSQHEIFLTHLARYPYLISHGNYIRLTGYVLEPPSSTDSDAPTQYLVVQELSEMEKRAGRTVGVNWERKRQEAKHWWRKEERGARGVRVGFFKLADAE